MQPVSANVSHAINGQEIFIGPGGLGVEITFELRAAGWASAPGSPPLRGGQARMESTSYQGANATPPNPGVDLMPKGYALPDPGGGNRSLGAFQVTEVCSISGRSCDPPNPGCAGGEGTCIPYPRWFMSCQSSIDAVDVSTIDYRYGGTILSINGCPDPNDPELGYMGTLILEIPTAAAGSYTILFEPTQTFLFDVDNETIPGTEFFPATITLDGTGLCNDSDACTVDLGTTGNCTFVPNYDTGTECCNPSDGSTQSVDDANVCTTDACVTTTGTVTHTPVTPGTPCGTPGDDCSNGDACNASGICQSNPKPNGTPCDDADPCTSNDTCQSAVCTGGGHALDGTECDDGDGCTAADICMSGVCAGTDSCVPTIRLQPQSSTGPYSIVNNEIQIYEGGVDVTFDVHVFGWSGAEVTELRGAQVTMNPDSYLGANASPANPGVDLMPMGYASPDPNGGNRELGFYMDVIRCDGGPLDGHVCEVSSDCNVGICNGRNPSFLLECCDPIYAANTATLEYAAGAAVSGQISGAQDSGNPEEGYLATLVLQVPAGAVGSYTVSFDPDPALTFMFGPQQEMIPIFSLQPGIITITNGLPAPAEAPDDSNQPKNRYVSFTPNSGAIPVALRVEMTASAYFSGAIGVVGWLGAPDAQGISAVLPSDTPVNSVTRVWTEPVVHAGDCAIVSAATYAISSTLDGGQNFTPPRYISTAAAPATKYWGDTVGVFNGTEWTAPNGFANINDVVAGIHKFQQLPSAPHIARVDVAGGSALDPCLNRTANFMDVFFLLKAMQGEPYPAPGPGACPASCP